VELTILPLGECCCTYEVIAPGVADGRRVHIPVSGYLVHLAGGELLLIDTGMHRVHITDPTHTFGSGPVADALRPVMRTEDSLLFRLAALQVAPQDIGYVINTHLHFDHAGNNDLLAAATFFVQRDHYEHAVDNPAFPNQYWRLPALRYELLDGAARLFDGVEVVPTPGHAPGHQSVLLRLPETGPVVVCGDAVFCADNIERDAWQGQADPQTARDSGRMLVQLAEREGAQLLYSHDPEQDRTLRHAPLSYR
jgi:N-acyl homoserine lactone hydrolase